MFGEKLLNELYVKYYNIVYIRVKKMLYSQVDDDITSCVQDTFIKAWENIEKLKKHENVAGWLIVTASGISGNFNKKYSIRKKFNVDIANIEDMVDEMDFTQDIIETIEFDKYLKLNIIESFLNKISKSERFLYELKFRQKQSNKDIANILEITPNAVASRSKRLIQKFNKFLTSKNK